MITYQKGDATLPQGEGPKLIAHVCNDAGGWGAGFVLAVSGRWPEPEKAYRSWYQAKVHPFGLGMIQPVAVAPDLTIVNMVAQHGYYSKSHPQPLNYEALRTCLIKLDHVANARQATIHMPRIGAGLGGGKWDTIASIIEESIPDIAVTVYDL